MVGKYRWPDTGQWQTASMIVIMVSVSGRLADRQQCHQLTTILQQYSSSTITIRILQIKYSHTYEYHGQMDHCECISSLIMNGINENFNEAATCDLQGVLENLTLLTCFYITKKKINHRICIGLSGIRFRYYLLWITLFESFKLWLWAMSYLWAMAINIFLISCKLQICLKQN